MNIDTQDTLATGHVFFSDNGPTRQTASGMLAFIDHAFSAYDPDFRDNEPISPGGNAVWKISVKVERVN